MQEEELHGQKDAKKALLSTERYLFRGKRSKVGGGDMRLGTQISVQMNWGRKLKEFTRTA